MYFFSDTYYIIRKKMKILCDCCKESFATGRCSKCHCAYYCGIECQNADWPEHSIVCRHFTSIQDGDSVGIILPDYEARTATPLNVRQLEFLRKRIPRSIEAHMNPSQAQAQGRYRQFFVSIAKPDMCKQAKKDRLNIALRREGIFYVKCMDETTWLSEFARQLSRPAVMNFIIHWYDLLELQYLPKIPSRLPK